MFCEYCGNKLDDGAVFCSACGKRIETDNDICMESSTTIADETNNLKNIANVENSIKPDTSTISESVGETKLSADSLAEKSSILSEDSDAEKQVDIPEISSNTPVSQDDRIWDNTKTEVAEQEKKDILDTPQNLILVEVKPAVEFALPSAQSENEIIPSEDSDAEKQVDIPETSSNTPVSQDDRIQDNTKTEVAEQEKKDIPDTPQNLILVEVKPAVEFALPSAQSENETISPASDEKEPVVPQTEKLVSKTDYGKVKKRRTIFMVLFIVFLAGTGVASGVAYWNYTIIQELSEEVISQKKLYTTKSSAYSELNTNYLDLQRQYNLLSILYDRTLKSPVFILVTRAYNAANNSTSLDHSKITYLNFDYTVLKDKDILNSEQVYVKIIAPDGSINRGLSSPSGYTTTIDINSRWTGWGTPTPGVTYRLSGFYTIEFWYKSVCIGRKMIYMS